jgi:carbon storage regulator
MLVLSRRPDEAIVIDGITRVVVIEVTGQVVKLGITAPRSIRILRSELHGAPVPSSSTALRIPEPAPVESGDDVAGE